MNTDLFCSEVRNIFTVSKLWLKNDILAIIFPCAMYSDHASYHIVMNIIVTVKKGKFDNLLEMFVFYVFTSIVTWSESFKKGC